MSTHRSALRAELDAAGVFEYRPGAVYLKTFVLVAATVGFFSVLFLAASWWVRAPAFLCGVATSIGLVIVAHDSGHGAISRNKLINDLPGWLLFPLFGGLSLPYWRYKHNTLHHSYTNVVDKDPDVAIYPFAMNPAQRATKPGFQRMVQSRQAVWFWPMTTLTTFAMRFDGLKFHVTNGRKVCSRRERWLDLTCLAGHYLTWLVLPPVLFDVSVLATVGFYVAWGAVGGLLLAAIFLPAHMTHPLLSSYEDNFLLQLQTTQNLKTNALFSFLLIGLDHQVEHHLFQRMSHLSVKKAARVTRSYCARHGLPYHEQGWGRALVECTRQFGRLPFLAPVVQPPVVTTEEVLAPAA